jgi:hypothetical protein
MKNELKKLLALGLIPLLMLIGCKSDPDGPDVPNPPVCENEDCECEDCDGEECDCNEELDLPKKQPPTRANFVEGLFATVESNAEFTNIEWATAVNNIENAFNARFPLIPEGIRNNFIKPAFGEAKEATIIVVKNPSFEKYSTERNSDIVYINYAILDDADTLGLTLEDAGRVMNGATNRPEVVQGRDKGWQRYGREQQC